MSSKCQEDMYETSCQQEMALHAPSLRMRLSMGDDVSHQVLMCCLLVLCLALTRNFESCSFTCPFTGSLPRKHPISHTDFFDILGACGHGSPPVHIDIVCPLLSMLFVVQVRQSQTFVVSLANKLTFQSWGMQPAFEARFPCKVYNT